MRSVLQKENIRPSTAQPGITRRPQSALRPSSAGRPISSLHGRRASLISESPGNDPADDEASDLTHGDLNIRLSLVINTTSFCLFSHFPFTLTSMGSYGFIFTIFIPDKIQILLLLLAFKASFKHAVLLTALCICGGLLFKGQHSIN